MNIEPGNYWNRLTIEGPAEAVAKADGLLVQGGAFPFGYIGFGKVIPVSVPQYPDPSAEQGGYDAWRKRLADGYMSAWGCSDEPGSAIHEEQAPERVSITFETKSGVAEKVMRELSRQVPDVTLSLAAVHASEPQKAAVAGRWVAGDGKLERVEPSREHYAHVRPSDDDGLNEHFPQAGMAP